MYSSTILDLSTRWGWVVGFTPRPPYSRRKRPRYTLDRRLCGPQSRSGHCVGEKSGTPAVKPVARCFTEWAISTPFDEISLYELSVDKTMRTKHPGSNISLLTEIPCTMYIFFAGYFRTLSVSNGNMINEWWTVKILESGGCDVTDELNQHFPCGTEDNHEKLQAE
jgi:hypothetical protein